MGEIPSAAGWRPSASVRAAAVVFAITLATAAGVDRLVSAAMRNEERVEAAGRLAPYAHSLSLVVDRRTAVLLGLKAFVEVRWGEPSFEDDFNAFAAAAESATPGIRALQYVEGGVVRGTWPRKGNEAIVGFDLNRHHDPDVPRDLRLAEQSSKLVLTGPIMLAQGGAGMVARIAARGRDGKLLCVVAAVLDLMPLLAEAQLDAAPGLVLTLRNENGRVLAGPPAPAGSEPVTIEVLLPDRRWKIEAWPAAGWSAAGALRLLAFRGRALVLCLLLSTLAWLLASQQAARARAREERTRHAADERFARLYQLIPDGVSLMRLPAEEIIEVNDAYLALSGYTRAELVGHTALEVGLWEDLPERERVGESLRKDGVVRAHPIRLRRKDGRVVEVDGSFRLFELEGEQCILGIIRDMTGARSLQLQLLQAQKMEAVGTLAGGVAHDFNNIISVILGYAELASQELPPGSTVRDDLEQIGEASKRAATLVRQLLAFSHRQVVEPRAVDVSAQAARTLRLLERVLPSDIKVETALPEGLTPVLVDPGHLEQVLMNLAVNARDAMPDGGKLEIRTSCEGEEVVLSVRDTGRGIPEQLQSRIFEPFFTTKPAGKGTGLGLATCYGIVKQAGGRIELRSAPGEGSTFRVLLPALRDSAPLRTTPEQLAAPPRGTETILLAEDEPQLRAATERILSGLGYRVLAAADGAEALALARAHAGSIALLVTDVMMPGLRGPELAGQLRKEMPSVRTLFISGYADAAALELARQDGAGYLGKPFTLERLAAAVREQLDRR